MVLTKKDNMFIKQAVFELLAEIERSIWNILRLWSKEQRIIVSENFLLAPLTRDGANKKRQHVYQTSSLRAFGQNRTKYMKCPTCCSTSVVSTENLFTIWVLLHMDHLQPVVPRKLHWVYNVNLQVVCSIGCLNIGEYTVKIPGAFGPYEKNNNNDSDSV